MPPKIITSLSVRVVSICLIFHIRALALTLQQGTMKSTLVKISEETWRRAAAAHSEKIYKILSPGFIPSDHLNNPNNGGCKLDPINPCFNFLIEYYSIRGSKGIRKLQRWSPDPSLLYKKYSIQNITCTEIQKDQGDDAMSKAAMDATFGLGGILLENANMSDFGCTLHLRGAIPVPSSMESSNDLYGVIYNPAIYYCRHLPHDKDEDKLKLLQTIAPFQWYRSIMQTTLDSEPIIHCHGLHEWAMQYHPEGADPPPSRKYQSSLPFRVSQKVINETVERKGVSCTHVDALRFFAPAAAPLNHHGSSLQRIDQLRLEQKACVHAHMDLLKIAMKIQPFLSSQIFVDALQIAVKARKLDVEASPYDAREYGVSIVPVETKEGRKMYREQQKALMEEAEPIRKRLLDAYDTFLNISFDPDIIYASRSQRKKILGDFNRTQIVDRDNIEMLNFDGTLHATAEPGSLPWRFNSKT